MKLLLAFFILSTSMSFAGVPTIKAKNVSCSELKEAFASYRSVYVIYGALGASRATFWESREDARLNCRLDSRVTESTFRTADGYCKVGHGCTPRRETSCRGRDC